jgi:hypothetical protein
MKLRRKKPKHTQAMDAIASVTKTWSEWQLGKKAVKGVAKAKDLRPPGKVKRALSLKWVKIGGGVAVAGGTAAAIGRKLKGDDPASYTGPPPSAAAEAAVPSPDTPAPLSVAPNPATQERETEPVGGSSTLRTSRDDAAGDAEPADPELVTDSAADAAAPEDAGDMTGVEAAAAADEAAEDAGDMTGVEEAAAAGAGEEAPADAETT